MLFVICWDFYTYYTYYSYISLDLMLLAGGLGACIGVLTGYWDFIYVYT